MNMNIGQTSYNFKETNLITGRNEVVAKVIFLHLSVIHSVHRGVCLSACWDTTTPLPPGADTPPPPTSRHPQRADPPGADTPSLQEQTPPRSRPPGPDPPRKQTAAYGLRAAGTHPPGMLSCFQKFSFHFRFTKPNEVI